MVFTASCTVYSQGFHLEVDVLITVEGKKTNDAYVEVYTGLQPAQRYDTNSKSIVNFVLDEGYLHRVVVQASDCTPKVLLFDTTDPKAKSDKYPCDVDLVKLSRHRRQHLNIEEIAPVGAIRWMKGRRKWAHDPSYTRELQVDN